MLDGESMSSENLTGEPTYSDIRTIVLVQKPQHFCSRFGLSFSPIKTQRKINLLQKPAESSNIGPIAPKAALWLHFRTSFALNFSSVFIHFLSFLLTLKSNEFADSFTLLIVFGIPKDVVLEAF